jgi:hypothetical protein
MLYYSLFLFELEKTLDFNKGKKVFGEGLKNI